MLDLDSPEDPAWYFMDVQLKWIKNQLKSEVMANQQIFQDFAPNIDIKSDDAKGKTVPADGTLDFASYDHNAKKFVYSVCHIVRHRLSSVWKMSRRILEGKFKKVCSSVLSLRSSYLFRNLQSILQTSNQTKIK